MMAASFFVWAGGRWCEVETRGGRVKGWRRRAQFVYFARGKLHLASTAKVLRGLRALASGHPTTVRDGAPLSQKRRKLLRRSRCMCGHQHCCKSPGAVTASAIKESPKKILLGSPPKVDTGIQVTLEAPSHSTKPNLEPVLNTKKSPPKPESQQCKELIINEDDVDLYRAYLIKNDPHFDLYRFDVDENYKLKVFFKINPLVNVERCPTIARMLRVSRSSQEMSLKDFATKLGLRSVSDQEMETKHRRSRRRKVNVITLGTSEEDVDKENRRGTRTENSAQPVLTRKTLMPKQSELLSKRLPEMDRVGASDSSKAKCSDVRTVGVGKSSSDSDFVSKPGSVKRTMEKVCSMKKPSTAKKMPAKNPLNRIRAGVREYSNLEDHAIVSWVSCGGRARLVNGNRLWAELAEQFPRLAGGQRTWHSLRNRYLRHLLPSLGALRLPQAQVSRLRAAAAHGELKARRKEKERRNSLLSLPTVRSAWSVRPRARLTSPPETPPLSPTPKDRDPPNKVPEVQTHYKQSDMKLQSHPAKKEAKTQNVGKAPQVIITRVPVGTTTSSQLMVERTLRARTSKPDSLETTTAKRKLRSSAANEKSTDHNLNTLRDSSADVNLPKTKDRSPKSKDHGLRDSSPDDSKVQTNSRERNSKSKDRSPNKSKDRTRNKSQDYILKRLRDSSPEESEDQLNSRDRHSKSKDRSPNKSKDRSCNKSQYYILKRLRDSSHTESLDRSSLRTRDGSPKSRKSMREHLRNRSFNKSRDRSPEEKGRSERPKNRRPRSRERSERRKDRSERPKDRPKSRDRLARSRERSERPKDRSPKSKDRSERPKDRSSRSKDRSPSRGRSVDKSWDRSMVSDSDISRTSEEHPVRKIRKLFNPNAPYNKLR